MTQGAAGTEATRLLPGPDGRKLAVECVGRPTGLPVFLMHGTPGSRRGPRPRTSVLYRLGIRLISYDRPGYGGSDRHPERRVADAARDVRAIAEALNLKTFSVVGRSGGAPHALACAADEDLRDCVTSVVVLVGLAPPNARGLDWYDGMTSSNKEEMSDRSAIPAILTERAERASSGPRWLLDMLWPELTRHDRRIVDEVAIQGLLTETYAEALRQGAEGWIDDSIALREPWGFDLERINVPVLIWHGLDDVFSPVSHARWLADHIMGDRDDGTVEVVLKPGAAHFDAVEALPDVFTWVKDIAARSESLRVDRAHHPSFRS